MIRVVDDQRVRHRDIQSGFNDRRTQQHVEFLLAEIQHHVLQRVLPHLAVRNRNARFRHELGELFVALVDRSDAVVEKEYLSAAADFAQNRVADHAVLIFHHVGLHGIARLRRRFQQAHVANADHGHVERARNRRGRHREHVHRLFHVLDAFLVAHAEALLLIDDEQAQVFKLHIFGQQPVRADDDVDFAVLEAAQALLLLLG